MEEIRESEREQTRQPKLDVARNISQQYENRLEISIWKMNDIANGKANENNRDKRRPMIKTI